MAFRSRRLRRRAPTTAAICSDFLASDCSSMCMFNGHVQALMWHADVTLLPAPPASIVVDFVPPAVNVCPFCCAWAMVFFLVLVCAEMDCICCLQWLKFFLVSKKHKQVTKQMSTRDECVSWVRWREVSENSAWTSEHVHTWGYSIYQQREIPKSITKYTLYTYMHIKHTFVFTNLWIRLHTHMRDARRAYSWGVWDLITWVHQGLVRKMQKRKGSNNNNYLELISVMGHVPFQSPASRCNTM